MENLEELLERFGGLGLPGDEAGGALPTRRRKTGGPGQPHVRLHVPSGSSTATTLKPSTTYDLVSQAPSQTVADASTLDPLILVVNLNHTLLYRASRTTKGSRRPVYRPYLSTFLEWVCEANKERGGKRRIEVVVYTATRAHNVRTLLEGMGLLASPYAALTSTSDPEHTPLVRLVLSREDFDLSASDYGSDIDTIKDLRRVWTKLGTSEEDGARRTVLLCDDAGDTVRFTSSFRSICAFLSMAKERRVDGLWNAQILQPFSHLPIPPFVPSLSLSSPSDADRSLLSTISLLSLISHETNIPAFVRSGGLEKEGMEGKVGEEMGRRECEERGVRVQSAFDGMWWKTILRRDG